MASSYEKQMLKIIREGDWPEYPAGLDIPRLRQIAGKVHRKKTVEGHLAAILIYHQISEEMLRMVLKWAQFYIRLCVFPTEFTPKIKPRLLYGQVISELDQTIDFPQKTAFLQACRELNSLRIDTVHKLTEHGPVENLIGKLDRSPAVFEQLDDCYGDIVGYFHREFDRRAQPIIADLGKATSQDL